MVTVNGAAKRLAKARKALDEALEAARLEAHDLIAQGMTEVDAADTLGVNRLTIRKWLGK